MFKYICGALNRFLIDVYVVVFSSFIKQLFLLFVAKFKLNSFGFFKTIKQQTKVNYNKL